MRRSDTGRASHAKCRSIARHGLESGGGDNVNDVQLLLPDKSATIIPLIVATDRTLLSTMCGGQQAYPVYVSIGNIPVDEFENVSDPNERARLKNKLTHDAMAKLMEPLKDAAKNGVVMTCADGRQRRVYPVPAAFEGDWPEQCAMACADEGGCPVCEQDYENRSEYPNQAPVRNPAATLAALRTYRQTKDVGDPMSTSTRPLCPTYSISSTRVLSRPVPSSGR